MQYTGHRHKSALTDKKLVAIIINFIFKTEVHFFFSVGANSSGRI
jgi:hypothetical protein